MQPSVIVTFMLVLITLPSCLTAPSYPGTYNDRKCGSWNQVADGYTIVDLGAEHDDMMIARCRVARTPDERCMARVHQDGAQQFEAIEKDIKLKNFAIGYGYLLYYVPGWALKKYWEKGHEESQEQLNTLVKQGRQECESNLAH